MPGESASDPARSATPQCNQGQATTEAFNVAGKTDILIRDGDCNIFVAECKIWSGSKQFTEAIDQLNKSAAWRDGKLALIVSVEGRDLTTIMERARDTLRASSVRSGCPPREQATSQDEVARR